MINDKRWLTIKDDFLLIDDYKVIREDLLTEMKEIFKLDSIPEYSADYIFINNIALAIWSSLQQVREIYRLHNINFASGRYLDKVMAFYNKYRVGARPYVIEVYLKGDTLKENDKIYDKTNVLNVFTIRHNVDIKNTGDYKCYLATGDDYYDNMTYDDVRKIKFQSYDINKSAYSVEDKFNNISVNQRKAESDDEFREKINEISNNEFLKNEISKIEGVQKVEIIGANNKVANRPTFINDICSKATLATGEILILVSFNNDYYKYDKEKQQNIVNEIDITISEFIPLGFVTLEAKTISANDNLKIKTHTQLSSLSDFINEEISFNEVQKTYGALAFIAYNEDINEVPSLCEDLINDINKKSFLFDYNHNETLDIIKDFFKVKDNTIYYAFNTYKPFSEVKWTEDSNSKIYELKDSCLKLTVSEPNSQALTKLNKLNDKFFKFNVDDYKYYKNSDGSISILLYTKGDN